MKRPRSKTPATPEESLKTLPLTEEQRDTLFSGMLEIRKEVLNYRGLARASPTPKERLRSLALAKTALANLTTSSRTPFQNDLIEAMDEGDDPWLTIVGRSPYGIRRSLLFLELVPVVKRYIDDMTAEDIRERWNDNDRRSVNQRRIDYETGAVLELVEQAGFDLDRPDAKTLELIRRIFAFTGQKLLSPSAVLKRFAAWKTPGKQNVYAFRDG